MTRKPKLELTWIGKVNRPKLEPRTLSKNARPWYRAAMLQGTRTDLKNVVACQP